MFSLTASFCFSFASCLFFFFFFNRTVGRGALRRDQCRAMPPLRAVVGAMTTRRAPPPSPAPAPQLLADPHVSCSSSSRISKYSLCVKSHQTLWIYYNKPRLQVTWLQIILFFFCSHSHRDEGGTQDRTSPLHDRHNIISIFLYCINVFILMYSFCTELIILYVSSPSYWIHALPFSTQWPLHPPHPWLRRHHPRNPTQLLIVLEDPWNPTLPQPNFPGEESGCDPHPT